MLGVPQRWHRHKPKAISGRALERKYDCIMRLLALDFAELTEPPRASECKYNALDLI